MKQPTYNHSRGDGAFNPCDVCLGLMNKKLLVRLVRDMRNKPQMKELLNRLTIISSLLDEKIEASDLKGLLAKLIIVCDANITSGWFQTGFNKKVKKIKLEYKKITGEKIERGYIIKTPSQLQAIIDDPIKFIEGKTHEELLGLVNKAITQLGVIEDAEEQDTLSSVYKDWNNSKAKIKRREE